MKKMCVFIMVFICLCFSVDSSNGIYADIVNYTISVNGEKTELKSAIVNIDGNAYIPLREVTNLLDVEIYWNGEEEKISIFTSVNKDKEDEEMDEKKLKAILDQYEIAVTGNDGWAAVMRSSDEKWGYINMKGEVVIPFMFEDASNFYEDMAPVGKYDSASWSYKYGFIDKTGSLVIPYRYAWTSIFSEGVCAVSDNKISCYFIDKNGKKLFDDKEFAFAGPYSEGYSVVKTQGMYNPGPKDKYSYIDHTGNFVTEQEWDSASDFKNGTAVVRNDGQKMRIDKNFEIVEYIES